jgi:hypothetical protein
MSANDLQSSWLHGDNSTASYRATEPFRLPPLTLFLQHTPTNQSQRTFVAGWMPSGNHWVRHARSCKAIFCEP